MNTKRLVEQLSLEGTPVKRTSSNSVRFFQWAGGAAFFIALGVSLIGTRQDLGEAAAHYVFYIQFCFMFSLGAFSILSALAESIPGRSINSLRAAPVMILAAWVLTLIFLCLTAGHAEPGTGLKCVRNILALGIFPGLILFFILRAAAPFNLGLITTWGAVGVAAFANLATQFICRNEAPSHIFAWHCLPVLASGGAGYLFGKFAKR